MKPWTKHGTASLNVEITNGQALMAQGTGLTTEEAIEAVCAVLPVVPAGETERLREALLVAAEDLYKAANQCEGLYQSARAMEGIENPSPSLSAKRFREKADRARRAGSMRMTGGMTDA